MKASRISNTAAYICIKLYGLMMNDKIARLFDDEINSYYDDLIRFLPRSLSWYYSGLGKPFLRKLLVGMEELLLPGDLMHIVARKYYIDKWLKDPHNEFEQLIIPGAGFDHSGLLYAGKGKSVFELDMPYMIKMKRDFFTSNFPTQKHPSLIELNLEEGSAMDHLKNTDGFDPDKKTLVLAEGFWDYLSLSTTESILNDLNTEIRDLKIISTMFDLEKLSTLSRFSFTSGVAMVGEAIKLPLNLSEFRDLLGSYDQQILRVKSYSDMDRELIHPLEMGLSVMPGFYLIESSGSN